MRRLLILLISLTLGLSATAQDQESDTGKDVIFNLKDDSVIKGVLVHDSPFGSDVAIITGDTIHIPAQTVESRYIKQFDVITISRGRYFYKSGFHIDVAGAVGFATSNGGFANIDISLNKRLTEKISVGAGIGNQIDFTTLQLPTGNSRSFLSISHRTVPLFIQGKYFLNKNKRRLYVHARTGYTIGRQVRWANDTSNNGFTAMYGVGLNKASKRGIRSFVQINQSHTYGSGTSNAWDWETGLSTEIDYSIWFNRISFTYGVEFNLQRRNKKF